MPNGKILDVDEIRKLKDMIDKMNNTNILKDLKNRETIKDTNYFSGCNSN